jgi:D-3-phosphoglycerate dehydrogenase
MLIIKNNDEPGAIGEIGTILGKLGININSMYVSPGVDNSAMMVVGIDRILNTKEVEEILKLKQFIHSVEQADISVFN